MSAMESICKKMLATGSAVVKDGKVVFGNGEWVDIPVTECSTADEVRYRTAAQTHYHVDGECEIDDDAVVSVSQDGGAYVAAWVWVYDEDAEVVTAQEGE